MLFRSALLELLGDVDTFRHLLNNEFFKQLTKDVEMVFDDIGKYYKENHATVTYRFETKINKKTQKNEVKKITCWSVINDCGNKMEFEGRWNNAKVTAHVYQGLESKILNTCIDYYKSKHDDTSYLLIHDGFYSQHELNTKDLEKIILDKTGLSVYFEPRKQTLDIEIVCKNFPDVYNMVVNNMLKKEMSQLKIA